MARTVGRGRRVLRRDRRLRSGRSLLAPGAARRSARRRRARPAHRLASPGRQSARSIRRCSPSCEAAVRHLEGRGAVVETVEEDVDGLRASLPGVLPGRAGRARRPAHGEVRGQDRAAACASRSSGARGGRRVDWANALGQRTAVYRRVQALFASLRFPRVADHRPARARRSTTTPSSRSRSAARPPARSAAPGIPICGPSISPATRPSRCRAGGPSDGLPIGLQIVGPWYADRRVLALAAHLERERPCGRPMPL